MDRRTFLTRSTATAAALGLAATGCFADDATEFGDPSTTTGAPTTTTEQVGTTAPPTTVPAQPIEPTVEEFFAAMNDALNTGADVPINDMPNVVTLLDGLEAAGYKVDRSDIAVVTHPDGRQFRLVP